jgi:hypothetical protein
MGTHLASNPTCTAYLNPILDQLLLDAGEFSSKCEKTLAMILAKKQRILAQSKEKIANIYKIAEKGINSFKEIESLLMSIMNEFEKNDKIVQAGNKFAAASMALKCNSDVENIIHLVKATEIETMNALNIKEMTQENEQKWIEIVEKTKVEYQKVNKTMEKNYEDQLAEMKNKALEIIRALGVDNTEEIWNIKDYAAIEAFNFKKIIKENNQKWNEIVEATRKEYESQIAETRNKAFKLIRILGVEDPERIWDSKEDTYIKSEEYDSKYICYFEDNSKNLCIVDITAEKDRKYALNSLNAEIYLSSAFCILQENRFFVSASQANNTSNFTLIIDIENQSITNCAGNDKGKLYSGECSYYENFVYVFGGLQGSSRNDCEKYNISTNNWINIANLPSASSFNCSVAVGNSIFVVGKQWRFVCRYNPIRNSFSSHGSFPDIYNDTKRISEFNGKLYIFATQKVYESTNSEMTEFSPIEDSWIGKSDAMSYTIRNGNYIYFLQRDKDIYRFNVMTRITDVLRSVRFT